MNRDTLIEAINAKLDAGRLKDYCPNGMQVEGRDEVKRIIISVSASEKLFLEAAKQKADLVIVHHGLIWNSYSGIIRGSYKKRVKALLDNDITLAAYHLPLDRHKELGNNILIAKALGLEELKTFGDYKGTDLGWQGKLSAPLSVEKFTQLLEAVCGGKVDRYGDGKSEISTVAIVSGGASDCANEAAVRGVDAYVTGEVCESVVRFSEEEGLHFFAAGHYATERFGIKALGEWISAEFGLEVIYLDLPVPV
ncbi:MAG: Nif3-like dinuclear metal center hexameric protein [Fibrobacteres bacterium]|nr:Nif3-like dinuclear metal center hexameric protein [Fibrobacterota bacterium]